MYLTEKEATERACQETFSGGFTSTHVNSRCIASKCMSWRWFATARRGAGDMTPYPVDDSDGLTRGYCGKVGRPE